MAPKVTVLLSVYNSATSLDRCFESIKEQSMPTWQIVCINDASTDNTATVLSRWKKQLGEKLAIIENERNLGLTQSLNKGLAQVKTPYTARIDADDWWHPEKLEKQLAFMEREPDYRLTGTNYINVSARGEKRMQLLEDDAAIRQGIIRRNPFAHSCVMFSTGLIRELGGYDASVRYGQDYDLWLRCLPHTKYANLSEYLCYRTVGSGISVEKQRQQMLQCFRTQIKYIRRYKLSPINLLYVCEPLIVAYTPDWLKALKRKAVG